MAGITRPAWLEAALRAGAPLHFRFKSPWLHNALNLAAAATVLTVIVETTRLGAEVRSFPYLPLAALVDGWAYFALLTLVIHEGSHGMFLLARDSGRRKRWNRLCGWMVAVPFAIHYQRHWEYGHLVHHRRPIEHDDPQSHNRLTGPELLRDLLLLVLVPGYAFAHRFLSRKAKARAHSSRALLTAFLVLWLGISLAVTRLCSGASAVALLLGLQILSAFNQVKGALEHGGDIAFEADPFLRSRSSFFPGRRLLLPFNVTLHFEHHLSAGVPWYDLPRLHRALRELVPAPLQPELFNRAVWSQLAGRKGHLPDLAP